MDEPTNHLDLPAREAIEAALREFDGTILIVTHDRYLLDAVTSRVLEFEDKPEIPKQEKISKPKTEKPSQPPKSKSQEKSVQQLEKLEAQIKMAEMELKMIEREINAAVEPAKLAELAAAHELKLQEIDELYTAFVEE